MKLQILITILLISLFTINLNADIATPFNSVNNFKSQNGKYEMASIPFYNFGKEGITIVKENDKILYQINGYFKNGIISDDGECVVLYSTEILKHDNREFLLDTVLFSVYKRGVLLKSYKVCDFFAFISDLSESTSYYYWLYERDDDEIASTIEVVGTMLKIKTCNELNWVIDLDSGELISRKYFSKNLDVERKVKVKNFRSMIQSIDSFEIVSIQAFSKGEENSQKRAYHAILRLKFNNNIFKVEVSTENLLNFKEKFSLLVKAIKQYVKQNKTKGVSFKICCYYFDKSNKNLISGFNPYYTPDNKEAFEVMNQTFLIRKDSGFVFLEVPVLIKYQLKGDAIVFDIVE